MSDILFSSKEMEELPAGSQAIKAIGSILERIRTEPTLGFLLGIGTQTYARLTEAFATLTCQDVEDVRLEFLNPDAKDPKETYKESSKTKRDLMSGACPCCGKKFEEGDDDLRRFVEDLVAIHATDVLPCPLCIADEKQLIDALRIKLENKNK